MSPTITDLPQGSPVDLPLPGKIRCIRVKIEVKAAGGTRLDLSDDPDLHLLADGARIDAHAVDFRMYEYQGVYRFRLERAPRQLFIASRICVPMRMGLNHDARRVGVAIRSIRLCGEGAGIDIDYDSDWLADGFGDPEPAARHRWTTGWAPLPRRCHRLFEGPFELMLDIVCTARYPLATPADAARAEVA